VGEFLEVRGRQERLLSGKREGAEKTGKTNKHDERAARATVHR
jgi:hypothetical protein